MTYPILNVLEPAETHDLLSLEEAKIVLKIAVDDNSRDEALQFMITSVSEAMARTVGIKTGGFGKEQLSEKIYDIVPNRRLYLSRFPVLRGEIEVLNVNGVSILADTDWVLEEATATLQKISGYWSGVVEAVYSAGYELPVEAPDDLKGAAKAGVSESYLDYERGVTLTGVRMISHKGARIQYQQPGQSTGKGGSSGLTPAWTAINNVLTHYMRPWI